MRLPPPVLVLVFVSVLVPVSSYAAPSPPDAKVDSVVVFVLGTTCRTSFTS